jgi:hypothetical protein
VVTSDRALTNKIEVVTLFMAIACQHFFTNITPSPISMSSDFVVTPKGFSPLSSSRTPSDPSLLISNQPFIRWRSGGSGNGPEGREHPIQCSVTSAATDDRLRKVSALWERCANEVVSDVVTATAQLASMPEEEPYISLLPLG